MVVNVVAWHKYQNRTLHAGCKAAVACMVVNVVAKYKIKVIIHVIASQLICEDTSCKLRSTSSPQLASSYSCSAPMKQPEQAKTLISLLRHAVISRSVQFPGFISPWRCMTVKWQLWPRFEGKNCCSNWANRALHSVQGAEKISNCLALGWGRNSYWWYWGCQMHKCESI